MSDPAKSSVSEENHAVLAEATQQELADLALRKDGYQLNDVLDVRDTVQKWMEGRIVQVDPKKGYYINYLGWSEKWNEWVPKGSNRLAPHRSYTTKSTAPPQNAGAHQLEGENMNKFRACAAKFLPILAKAKTRCESKEKDAASKSASSGGDAELTEADWTFIHGEVCNTVQNVLNSVINDLAAVPDAAKFLLDFLQFTTYLLRADASIKPVILETLMRTLNCDPTQTTDKRFFTKYGVAGTETWEDGNKGKYAVRPKASGAGDSLKVTSAYLIQLINRFGEWGGFDAMAKRVQAEGDAAPNFLQYAYFATIFGGLEALFETRMSKKVVPTLKWDVKAILHRITQVTDDELKLLPRDMLRAMTTKLIDLLLANKEIKMKPSEAADKVQLAIILRLLHSTILEKRINGILDLADVVKVLKITASARNGMGLSLRAEQERNALPPCHTTPKTFLEWVEKSNVVQLILALDSHEEILKRSPIVLKYLAANDALKVEHIFNLFDSVLGSGTAHEGFVRIVYDLVADVSSELNDATLDQLIARLNTIPKSAYTEVYMRFLCKLAQMCSKSQQSRAVPLLQVFWDLITAPDGTGVSSDVSSIAIQIMAELFALPQFNDQRIPHVERAMKSLQVANAPVLKLLKFLHNTLNTFPAQSDPSIWSQETLIGALDNKLGLTKIYFDEITRYHELAKKTFEELPAEERATANPIVSGASTHTENLQARLDFLQFCLDRCKAFPIIPSHIDILWQVFYVGALTPNDGNQLFRWLQLLIDDGSDAGSSQRRRPYTPFTDVVMKHIFTLLLNKTDFGTLSIDAYRCIELYFCYVNHLLGHLAYASKRHMVVMSPQNLVGIDRLWLLASTNNDKRIGVTSRILLVSLYTKLDPKTSSKRRHEAYSLFLDRCVTDLAMFKSCIQNSQEVQENTRRAVQYLLILDIFLTSCDKIVAAAEAAAAAPPGGPNSPPRAEGDVKEPSIDPKTSLDPVLNFHRFTLSNNQAYFNSLFDLLPLGGEIATRVWQLLTKLPTNQELEHKIVGIASTVANGATEPPAPIDWASLLASNSNIKMLYILQIIHTHLRRGSDPEGMRLVQAWSQVFLLNGGFAFTYNFVQSIDLDAMFNESPLSQQCLASLVKLLNTFMAFAPGSAPAKVSDAAIDYSRFIPLLLKIVEKSVQIQAPEADPNGHNAVVESDAQVRLGGLISNTFQLLSYCLNRQPADSPLIQLVTGFDRWDAILQSGLDHALLQIRDQTAEGIEILCTDVNLDVNSNTNATPPPSSPLTASLIGVFLPKLLNLLSRVETRSVRCLAYFNVTRKLLSRAPSVGVAVDSASLMNYLIDRIRRQPIIEARASDEDFVLAGLFHLLQELFHNQPTLKSNCDGLVKELYDSLFTLPNTANVAALDGSASSSSSSDSDSSLPPPKCKSQYSRRSAFCLLDELVLESPANLRSLVELLIPLHRTTHSGGTRPDEWEFESKADEKADCGYVGLRNAGSICYLNSTVQQFFMIPEFRKNLLAATESKPEAPQTSVLYQLQYIMAFLQESEKQAFDPLGLCKSFVDFDGNPINVGVQEDAAGFVTRLIDKVLDQIDRNSPIHAALKSTIYGQTVDQFIGHPPKCTHYKERTEEFPTIPLTVKNMKTIHDSLKSFVQGEDMTGGNAYKCNQCDAKVDTTKRTVFSQLPPTLIFNLKRFSLNYETMRTVKINDYWEFPMTLNMKPYTKVGIQEAEKAAAAAASRDAVSSEAPASPSTAAETMPDSYYEYELTGVTVHTGSMDRGHYYSFINTDRASTKSRDQTWFEFNDTVVRPFDIRNMADECFGGEERIQQFNAAGRSVETIVEKQRNAYLLFYTRKSSTTDSNAPDADSTASTSVPPPAKLTRTTSLRQKAPLPPAIFNSVWEQNLTYWRDRYVFDTMYFDFLYSIAMRTFWITEAQKRIAESKATTMVIHGVTVNADDLTSLSSLVTQLSTRFVLETLCRSRQKQLLPAWSVILSNSYRSSRAAGRWFLQTMTQTPNWTHEILLGCPIVEVRQALSVLISQVIQTISEEHQEAAEIRAQSRRPAEPHSQNAVVLPYIDSLVASFRILPEWWRRFNQFFRVLQQFALISSDHTAYLLIRHDGLARLLDLYLGDASPLPNNVFGMPVNPTTKKRPIIGDTLIRPDMTAFLGLAARLVCASATLKAGVVPPSSVVADASVPGPTLLPLFEGALTILNSKIFLTRLLSDATSRRRGEYISLLLGHLCFENIEYSKSVIGAIVTGIKTDQHDTLRPYFRVIGGLLAWNDSIQATRQDIMLQSLLVVLEQQSTYWKATDFCLEHLLRLAKLDPSIPKWIQSHSSKSDWIVGWLKVHPMPPRQGEAILMYKPGRIDPATQMQAFNPYDFAAFAPRSWPSMQHNAQQKLALFERMRTGSAALDPAYASDSDEELADRTFRIGQYVDVLDTVNKFLVAKIVEISPDGKSVKVHFDNWNPRYDEWLPIDSIRITRFGRFSNRIIVEQPEGGSVEESAAGVSNLSIEKEGAK